MKRPPRPLPSGSLPVVREFHSALCGQDLTLIEICHRARLDPGVISFWLRGRNTPRLPNFEAALNAIGYRLTIVPIGDRNEHKQAS